MHDAVSVFSRFIIIIIWKKRYIWLNCSTQLHKMVRGQVWDEKLCLRPWGNQVFHEFGHSVKSQIRSFFYSKDLRMWESQCNGARDWWWVWPPSTYIYELWGYLFPFYFFFFLLVFGWWQAAAQLLLLPCCLV